MRALGVVGLILICAAPADAAPFTWLVQGTVTTVNATAPPGPYSSVVHVGDNIDWWVTFDTAAPDIDPSVDCGQYTPILSMAFQDGAVGLSQPTRPGQDYLVKSATYSPGSACETLVPPNPNTARIRAGFDDGLMVSLHLAGSFATDALPLDPTGLRAIGFDFFYSSFGNPIASAAVTRIRAVPEPAGAVLAIGGMIATIRRRRRSLGKTSRSPADGGPTP